MSQKSLKLLHLSDIHFKKNDSPVFVDLRDQLEKDAERVRNQVGDVNGILITGDIAFSGKPHEYAIALDWLDKLSTRIGCPAENVWTIPGNHDVDRTEIQNNPVIKTIQHDLRSGGPNSIDARIDELFRSSEGAELIYRPIKNYISEFAAKYKCAISAAQPYVKHDFTLNDGSILRLRGVNSTIISDEHDNEGDNKLAVGEYQSIMLQEDGVEYLLMCHHPYPWLLDYDARQDHWLARARIQLFGHKHKQKLRRIGDSLIVSAGAMQPSRQESEWIPRYNFLDIAVSGKDKKRSLIVKVFPRSWSEDNQAFQPDYSSTSGKPHRQYKLPVEGITPKKLLKKVQDSVEANSRNHLISDKEKSVISSQERISVRKLTHNFLRLPLNKQIDIFNKMGLLQDEVQKLDVPLLFPRLYRRAAEQHKLQDLISIIDAAYQDINK